MVSFALLLSPQSLFHVIRQEERVIGRTDIRRRIREKKNKTKNLSLCKCKQFK